MTVPQAKGLLVENKGNQTKRVGEERCVHPTHAPLLGRRAPRLITDILLGQRTWGGSRGQKGWLTCDDIRQITTVLSSRATAGRWVASIL